MMQHLKMGLMDAYLVTRARRLNVLIQPNLRFFHELFGWEVELAREEERIIAQRRKEANDAGVLDPEALAGLEEGRRRIYYAWPSFCRDLVSAGKGEEGWGGDVEASHANGGVEERRKGCKVEDSGAQRRGGGGGRRERAKVGKCQGNRVSRVREINGQSGLG